MTAQWEEIVLGTVLQEPASYLDAAFLKDTDWQRNNHNVVWRGITELYGNGGLTRRNVIEYLRDNNRLEVVGDGSHKGEAYLEFISGAADPSSFPHAVKQVLESGMKIDLQLMSTWLHGASLNGKPAGEITDEAMQKLLDVRRTGVDRPRPIGHYLPEYTRRIDDIRAGRKVSAWAPALEPIRKYVGHLDPKEFVIVAGQSGGGKSSYLRYEGLEAALNGMKVITFNGENDEMWYLSFAIAALSGIDTFLLKNPRQMSNAQFTKYQEAVEKIAGLPWMVMPMPRSVQEMKFLVMQEHVKGKVSMIQVDQVQNLSAVTFEDIEQTTYDLRHMAMSVSIPVMAAHQLRRGNYEKTPEETALLYAGERAAKNIWMVWPQDINNGQARLFPANVTPNGKLRDPHNRKTEVLRFHIAKQSAGPTGLTGDIAWHKHLNRFEPLERNWREGIVRSM
jgi:replicative DNA helicase